MPHPVVGVIRQRVRTGITKQVTGVRDKLVSDPLLLLKLFPAVMLRQ